MASSASFSHLGNKEQSSGEWNVVIKVKYGDVLRRFSAHVHLRSYLGHELCIDYDMNQLRAKISGLFKFGDDAALLLTYTDEDGDVVCLDSDDELRDAVISQRLNPLRITVQIKPYTTDSKTEKSSDIRSHAATPALNGFRQFATELNSAVDKSLKSLPDPVRGVLSNISHDMIQSASSAPVFNELFSLLSNMQLANVSQLSCEPVDKSTGLSKGVSSSTVDHNMNDEPKAPSFPTPVPERVHMNNCDGNSENTSKEQNDNYHDGKSAAEPPPVLVGSQSDVSGNSHDNPALFSCSSTLHPYGRPSGCVNYMSRTFHRGVICDGCGMHPIIGPRYKSTVKGNYDLCWTCFRDMGGREPEYTRIDSAFQFPKAKKHHHKHNHRGRIFPTFVLDNMLKPPTPKLCSSFVFDVTVWDGTLMRPGSRFTKIWRMRNTGTIAWPSGTQLVWVGGHQLGVHGTAQLEIPVGYPPVGYPVDRELDIAVDCVAPSVPGKYISYWQMASSSGQKFGDEVWISIQVCDLQSTSTTVSSFPTALTLNLPPESNHTSGPVIMDAVPVPLGGMPADDKPVEPAAQDMLNLIPEDFNSVSQPPNAIPAASFCLTSDLSPLKISPVSSNAIPASSSCPVRNPAVDIPTSSVISYPLIDFSTLSNPPGINYTPSDNLADENPVELTLLKELEEMGFMQTDLNKDILRQNRYDLEQSVEELCEFAEWDPLLKELHEMGFNDTYMNRELLTKNGGSIKRVVMELIAGKKDE